MSMTHPPLIWRDMTVFDGLTELPGLMAVVVDGERIANVCPTDALDPALAERGIEIGRGGLMTPGLVDCHTHLVFGGSRSDEFEQRLEGTSYADIARAGGGILSTVRATRAASEDELFDSARARLEALIDDGVTTVEIKSGYGLTLADELKMLRVARRLGERLPVRVVTTLLGAHALPPEYADDADAYVALVCDGMIPCASAEGLADAVDVFCETIGFDLAQCERIYQTAQRHGLPFKVHAEQLSNMGGAALAARYGALSVDHIEYLDEAGVVALAAAGTVATLLPAAYYSLRESQLPPIEALRRHGVPMALASDANPGSAPLYFPTLVLNLACTLFRLTPREALAGMTTHAARALGRSNIGRVAPGLRADLCIWNAERAADLAGVVQPGRLRQRVVNGIVTHAN
jgi:imidazolonepropionase